MSKDESSTTTCCLPRIACPQSMSRSTKDPETKHAQDRPITLSMRLLRLSQPRIRPVDSLTSVAQAT